MGRLPLTAAEDPVARWPLTAEGPSVLNTVQTPLYNAICPSLHTPFPHFMPVLHTQYTFHSTFKQGKKKKLKKQSTSNNVHANEPMPCTFYLCVEKIQDPPNNSVWVSDADWSQVGTASITSYRQSHNLCRQENSLSTVMPCIQQPAQMTTESQQLGLDHCTTGKRPFTHTHRAKVLKGTPS